MNDPLDHLIFHHGRKPLGDQLAPPLGILIERFLALIFYPLKNYAVRSYLSIEPVILQECISHLSKARGLFQSHIACGCGTNQAIKANLAEQRMIISTGCHLPTKHVQMGIRISTAIILDELRSLELRRHIDLREIGQIVQIDTSSSAKALYATIFSIRFSTLLLT